MWRRWGKLVVHLMALHSWPPIALAVGTLAAADDSAGAFGSAGCWLPDAFGHFGLRELGEYGEGQFTGIVEEILYPTLSNQHIHVYYILRFAYLGLFSTSTPKGSKTNSQGMSGHVRASGLGCSSCGASTPRHAVTSLQPGGKSLFNSREGDSAIGLGAFWSSACVIVGRQLHWWMSGLLGFGFCSKTAKNVFDSFFLQKKVVNVCLFPQSHGKFIGNLKPFVAFVAWSVTSNLRCAPSQRF